MKTGSAWVCLWAGLLTVLLATLPARATVNQSDGTIIPVGPSLQSCLDKSATYSPTTNPAPAEGTRPFRILTVPDARTQPQTFAIPAAPGGGRQISTFTDIGEGSGFENVFGWYHVGDDPQVPANRHVIIGPRPGPVCPCPCSGGPRRNPDPPSPCLTWTPNPADAGNPSAPVSNNIVQVDWTCLASMGIYRGGPIAFYVEQTNAFVFSTLTRDNSDRDIHFLVYQSKNFPRRFYFAYEDLTRSPTQEFSDLVVSGTEIVPACDPRPEICDGIDQNCDGVPDDNIPPLRCPVAGDTTGACTFEHPACIAGVPQSCPARSVEAEVCDGVDNDCDGTVDEGISRPCENTSYPEGTRCRSGVQYCINGAFGTCVSPAPQTEVCDGVDNDCDGAVDDNLGQSTCGVGACQRTVDNCASGRPQTCTPGTPTDEVCNNIDDDCDGAVDEGVSRNCTNACGPGTETCVAGTWGMCLGRAPASEVCDGLDNDCDGMTDEGLGTLTCGVGACQRTVPLCLGGRNQTCTPGSPMPEVCNGIDDDCDGAIDENITRSCTNACGPGTETCTAGMFGPCIGRTVATEVCDGVDNDCDGMTDENLGQTSCGVGACRRTVDNCVSGRIQTCTPGSPSTETCNNIDDDCDGLVDEGITEACTTACGPGVRTCMAGAFGPCTGRAPTSEVCDGTDNDCDGETDEGLGDTTCGVGACQRTVPNCVSGAVNTCTPGAPGTETCNGIDDDCDGVIDEGITRPCSTACGSGIARCVRGTFGVCESRSPTTEICNGIDDDCDGMTDEDLGTTRCGIGACARTSPNCVDGRLHSCTPGEPRPEECNNIDDDCDGLVDDGLTRACMAACGEGRQTCSAGVWGDCTSDATPRSEICNGFDDDCDGMVDEDVPMGGVCGSSIGACRPGRFVCRMGRYVCDGEVPPTEEVCNGIDDDCDGVIDDGNPGGGGPCGTVSSSDDMSLCGQGVLRCRGGMLVCEGARTGSREVCNCVDDDCDGTIDEDPEGNLCAGGGRCIDCACRTPCRDGEFPCSAGQVCRDGFCFPDTCGGVRCAPDQVCVNDRCVDRCEAVTCPAGRVCHQGLCVENNCYGLGCPAGQLCLNGACMPNPCADVRCPAGHFCRDGACVRSCSAVVCHEGQTCRDGRCITDPCYGRTCPTGQVCRVTASGARCVPDPCRGVTCDVPRVCVEGVCTDNPCLRVRCASDEVCTVHEGTPQCEPRNGLWIVPARDRAVAIGNGVGCSVMVPVGGRDGSVGIVGLVVLVLYGRRIRRRTRTQGLVRATVVLLLAAMLWGCRVEPYCFNCVDGSPRPQQIVPVDGYSYGDGSGSTDRDGSGVCRDGATEVCNGRDDNCNGLIDEGIDINTDPRNCGRCGVECAPAHAVGACMMGVCGIGRCDVSFWDLNGDPADGCEYRCDFTGPEICDGVDNDCDGRIDEDFDLQTDLVNCGSCGTVCRFNNAGARCVMGRCEMTDCVPGYLDIDRDPATGCEYACVPTGPEVCDNRDNDCDRLVDEDFGVDSDVDNCGGCGRRCVAPNGVPACRMGVCVVASCMPGYRDIDGRFENGCEWMCGNGEGTVGPETCDGVDNDCDGTIDEEITERCTTACGDGTRTCMFGTFGPCIGPMPGLEVCNGRDDDCDGMTDENLGTTTCGVGACVRTVSNCVDGVEQTCTPGTPGTEVCNNIDDDCDGTVDEDVTRTCSTACGPGVQTCLAGSWGTCVGRLPTLEVCDGVDNDCDGMTDEDLGTVTCGMGACARTVAACADGRTQICTPGTPGTEICNNVDDDCDGMVDEDVTRACSTACGPGTQTCYAGTWGTCVGRPPTAETCNGVDDDCNGVVDDNLGTTTCGVGACRTTVQNCVGGVAQTCTPLPPGTEECNGVDDDCDGMVDEDLVRSCTGTCGPGTQTCIGAGVWGPCIGRAPTAESCNGVDDDCNGVVDDNLGTTTCGVGACVRTVDNCVGGAVQTCTPGTPGVEECNNVDDDCDGVVDESPIAGLGVSCGMCGRGTLVCQSGRVVCQGDVSPRTEICNGIDDDCDGRVDEEPLPGVGPSYTCGSNVGACTFGWFACVGGMVVCQGGTGPSAEVCNGRDDDCDGLVDEDLTPPSIMCDRYRPPGATGPVGVCAGASLAVVCGGSMGWTCTYPSTYRDRADEAYCDGLDNNCDGRVDEGCLTLGLSSDVRVEANVSVNATTPVIHGNGTVVGIAWSQRPLSGPPTDVNFARSTDVSNAWRTWSVPVRLDTNSASQGNSIEPDLVFNGSNLLVAWGDDRSGPYGIFGRRSTAAGASFFSNDEFVSNNNRPSFRVKVGVWGDNTAIAVWETALEAGISRHIFATRVMGFTSSGSPWIPSPPVQIDHAPYAVLATDVDLALGGPGVAYVVWRDERNGSGDIWFQRTMDHGATWLPTDTRVNTQPTAREVIHDAQTPSVAAYGSTVYVAWSELRIPDPLTVNPDRYDIYANVSTDAGGSFRPSSSRVETDPLKHESLRPTVVALSNTIGVVVWEDWRSGYPSVRSNRTTDAGVTWGVRDVPAQGGAGGRPGRSASVGVVAAGAGSTVFVAWADDRDEPEDPLTRTPAHYNVYANFSLDAGESFQPQDIRLDTAPLGTDQEQPTVFTVGNVGHFAWIDRRNASSTGDTNHQGDVYYRNLR